MEDQAARARNSLYTDTHALSINIRSFECGFSLHILVCGRLQAVTHFLLLVVGRLACCTPGRLLDTVACCSFWPGVCLTCTSRRLGVQR